MTKNRLDNLNIYEKEKTEEDSVENAELCEQIGRMNFMASEKEALYWKKKGLKIREKLFGKNNVENTPYYDVIVEILIINKDYKTALKWNQKSYNIREKSEFKDEYGIIKNYLLFIDIYEGLDEYELCNEYLDRTFNLLENNQEISLEKKYQYYMKLNKQYYHALKREENKELFSEMEDKCLDRAMEVVLKEYGENSIQMAQIYMGKIPKIDVVKDKDKKLDYIKRAMKIIVKEKGVEFEDDTLRKLYLQLWSLYEKEYDEREYNEDKCLGKAIAWIYQNVSEQLAFNIIKTYGYRKLGENIAREVYASLYGDIEEYENDTKIIKTEMLVWIYKNISEELVEYILKGYENEMLKNEINNILIEIKTKGEVK